MRLSVVLSRFRPGSPSTPETDPTSVVQELRPLGPGRVQNDHDAYVESLVSVLNRPTRAGGELPPRNIALTGSYGTGKSSVLLAVRERLGRRTITLSLATLGVTARTNGDTQSPDDDSPTNSIQKEIVKQLLYIEKPQRMRGSRYRRILPFRWIPAILWSIAAAGVASAIFWATGAADTVAGRLPWPLGLSVTAVLGVAALGVFGLVLASTRLLYGRLRISRVSSEMTSISLSDEDTSYFDKFLDEIVFFFQRTGYDIVLFEDIDRFDDPNIFENLRELNTVLNSSKQVRRKPVRFVYAIRDSIFESLGSGGSRVPVPAETAATNRTKFFDLVVPIVPFVSSRLSHSHLAEQLLASKRKPRNDVIAAVSPFITDMRLIKNICNEFDIFASLVLEDDLELEVDKLFALVVYKNLYLGEFEKIHTGTSVLDTLYEQFRALVARNITDVDAQIRQNTLDLEAKPEITEAAELLARRGKLLVDGSPTYELDFTIGTETFSSEEARDIRFWELLESHGNVDISRGSRTKNLTTDQVSELIGVQVAPAQWSDSHRSRLKERGTVLQRQRNQLRTATMQTMLADPSFTKPYNDTDATLDFIAEQLVPPLVQVLLKKGYIDENYPFYATKYHSGALSAAARGFIHRSVQPRKPNFEHEFRDDDDIEAMIAECDARVLEEESVFNTAIFNYLLRADPRRLRHGFELLANATSDGHPFTLAYLQNGQWPEAFVRELAPRWPGIFGFLMKNEGLGAAKVRTALDVAFGTASASVDYEADDAIADRLDALFPELPVFRNRATDEEAENAARALASLHLRVRQLDAITPPTRLAVARARAYTLTDSNLRQAAAALTGEPIKRQRASLDGLHQIPDVYEYVTENLNLYLEGTDGPTITDRTEFATILHSIAGQPEALIERVIERSSKPCRVRAITEVPEELWPILIRTGRAAVSVQNLSTYLKFHNQLDDEVAGWLGAASISVSPEDSDKVRTEMAIAVLNAAAVSARDSIRLATEILSTLQLAIQTVKVREGKWVGELVKRGVISDSPEVWGHLAGQEWTTKLAYITRSSKFAGYIPRLMLEDTDFHNLATHAHVPDSVRDALIADLASYAHVDDPQAFEALARQLLEPLHPVGIDAWEILESRIDPDLALKLLAKLSANVDTATFYDLVESRGPEFSLLATPGTDIPTVTDSPGMQELLAALKTHGVVTSTRPGREPGTISVRKKRSW